MVVNRYLKISADPMVMNRYLKSISADPEVVNRYVKSFPADPNGATQYLGIAIRAGRMT